MAFINKSNLHKIHPGKKIKKLSCFNYNDIKDGMVVRIDDDERHEIFIAIDYKNLAPLFSQQLGRDPDNVFVTYSINTRLNFSFWRKSQFFKLFLVHQNWTGVRITEVWETDINTKLILTTEDLK